MSLPSSVPVVIKIMALSENVSEQAGIVIKDIMYDGYLRSRNQEANHERIKKAARSAQRCIIASLRNQFPKINIIGKEEDCSDLNVPEDWLVTEMEESHFFKYYEVISQMPGDVPDELIDVKEEDVTVWVDPLNGRSAFFHESPLQVTVLIGIAVKNYPVGGIIHQPYCVQPEKGLLFRTVWGLKGVGAAGSFTRDPPDDIFIVTTTLLHSNPIVQSAVEAIMEAQLPSKLEKACGSGYKILQLLQGSAHAYVFASSETTKFDTCAPEAILEAVDGKLTDVFGYYYDYHVNAEHTNNKGVLATIKASHSDIVNNMPQNVKDAMNK